MAAIGRSCLSVIASRPRSVAGRNVDPAIVPIYYLDADGDNHVDGDDATAVNNNLGYTSTPNYADLNGRPITLYTYDPAGNLTSQTDANGNTTQFENDIRGRRVKEVQPPLKRSVGLFGR
jgi:YD repeat-containing protein